MGEIHDPNPDGNHTPRQPSERLVDVETLRADAVLASGQWVAPLATPNDVLVLCDVASAAEAYDKARCLGDFDQEAATLAAMGEALRRCSFRAEAR